MLPSVLAKGVGEVELCLFFAMHNEDMFQAGGLLARDIAKDFVVVGMSGEGFDTPNLCTHLVSLAEDRHLFLATHDFGSQGGRLTIADAKDGGGRIVDVVGKVVFDTSGFHHAAGRDDDTGLVTDIELLRLFDRLDVV